MQASTNNHDPYKDIQVGHTELKEYQYGIGQTAFAVFFLAGFLLGNFLLLRGVLFSEIGPLFMGSIMFLSFGFGMFTRVKAFQLDEAGIKVNYWFRPSQKLAWNEIISLEIKLGRGRWCDIKAKNKTVVFPIDDIYGLESKSMMIKTIIEQAHLKFTKKSFWGNLTYKRSEMLV